MLGVCGFNVCAVSSTRIHALKAEGSSLNARLKLPSTKLPLLMPCAMVTVVAVVAGLRFGCVMAAGLRFGCVMAVGLGFGCVMVAG